jgi:hypothetical protein
MSGGTTARSILSLPAASVVRLESPAGIVEHERVDRLDLEAADAAVLHLADLACKAGLRDRRPEPPPPHHDPRLVWRRAEEALEVGGPGPRLAAGSEGGDAGGHERECDGVARPSAASGLHNGAVVYHIGTVMPV